ncbi:hypothetical protein [Chitinophaga sp. Cy-1792]|uniref:hypothetical protein n=1 Tax=Chitinophaga sp. Cy-1792 TaxID=2608339 RepID=UPI001421E55C|nr:hypothetical protein [Chitinophaga sp. Cy-1792]NIG56732.1 hypothetical protein [Chitinophaga sp. Cy-1792]
MIRRLLFTFICLLGPFHVFAQQTEKVVFNDKDYYLAVKPNSENINGVLVLLRSFGPPEAMVPETNLAAVAAANDILTILVSTRQKIYADSFTVDKLNQVITHVIQKYKADTAKFAIGAYDYAGTIALRYAELAKAGTHKVPVVPKAVFVADSPTDLFRLWDRLEGTIKKDYYEGEVNDAKFLLDKMRTENGDIHTNAARYRELSPFIVSSATPGNEQLLKDMAVRVYFDTDINWQLVNRRNSLYDTNIPDGSEFIKRLLLAGNDKAAFISARPGMQPTGVRNPNSFSIIEEMECVKWLKKSMGIFDPLNWEKPYQLSVPKNWSKELLSFPPDFAPTIPGKGVEELSFAPGWGDSKSPEYWSYCYSWLLDGKLTPDEAELKSSLTTYYEGLVKRNIGPRKIPADKVFPTQVKLKKDKSGHVFTGTIYMLDYMEQKPVTLNVVVVRKDGVLPDKTVFFINVSPQPMEHRVWKQLNAIEASFR